MTDTVKLFLDDIECALQRFEPKPGDVFVLTIRDEVSLEQQARLVADWKKRIPFDVEVVVVTGDVSVELQSHGRASAA